MQNILIAKIILYTGISVKNLVKIRIENIHINDGIINIDNRHDKQTIFFPLLLKEELIIYITSVIKLGNVFLFESVRKQAYSERGIRKILINQARDSETLHLTTAYKLRQFLLSWMKKQNISSRLMSFLSKHSLDNMSSLNIKDIRREYDKVISHFPV